MRTVLFEIQQDEYANRLKTPRRSSISGQMLAHSAEALVKLDEMESAIANIVGAVNSQVQIQYLLIDHDQTAKYRVSTIEFISCKVKNRQLLICF